MTGCEMCGWVPGRKVKAKWLVTGKAILPSANVVGANTKGASGHKYRKWRTSIDAAIKDQLNQVPRARRHRTGIITRYYSGDFRAYDEENFIGGCKPLIDVLRAYGVLQNDNKAWWKGHYRQLPSTTGETYFTVELYEFEP
jgi:hypothetical protein